MEAKNCFAADNRLNWPWGCSQKRMKMDNFRKIRIALGLCIALSAGFISVRAADNPAQAAARVALERILNSSDDSQAKSLPATNTLSEAAVEQPVKSAANVTEIAPEKAVTPQIALVATTPVAAPVADAPAAVAPAAVSPVAVAPVAAASAPVAPTAAPAMPFLMLWGLLLSLLVISFVIMSLLLLRLRQVKLLLLKHSNVMASSRIQPAATATKRPVQQRKQVPHNGAEVESKAKN
jgi:hypothetical protein